MKSIKIFLSTLSIMAVFATHSYAEPRAPKTVREILVQSLTKTLKLENLNECLGRGIEQRFFTSDCTNFLYQFDEITTLALERAFIAYNTTTGDCETEQAEAALEIYKSLLEDVVHLKHQHLEIFDLQSVVFKVRYETLRTREKILKLK
jgi:hypothetical protein